jgi:transposase InsO family protein
MDKKKSKTTYDVHQFAQQKDVTGLIVHSDQGCQYTSYAYHDMLPQVGAQISMSRRGNCYDNAVRLKLNKLTPLEYRRQLVA